MITKKEMIKKTIITKNKSQRKSDDGQTRMSGRDLETLKK